MRAAREIIDGKLRCSKCKQPKLAIYFSKDNSTSIGYGYRCRSCRQEHDFSKVKLVEPDFEAVPSSRFPMYENDGITVPGAWERVVALAKILSASEVVFIPCDPHYRKHYSVEMGLRVAAKKHKAKVRIAHGLDGVYVQNAKVMRGTAK